MPSKPQQVLNWWRRQESNPRTWRCQRQALPAKVRLHKAPYNKNRASAPRGMVFERLREVSRYGGRSYLFECGSLMPKNGKRFSHQWVIKEESSHAMRPRALRRFHGLRDPGGTNGSFPWRSRNRQHVKHRQARGCSGLPSVPISRGRLRASEVRSVHSVWGERASTGRPTFVQVPTTKPVVTRLLLVSDHPRTDLPLSVPASSPSRKPR